MVTVVVPIFKTERYLSQCIESILGQSYTDLQVILVDGDSPDGSRKISEAYAAKDARIQIICHENLGLSADRNVGIEAAKGEYIMFADGDDFMALDMIEKMLQVAHKEGADIVACRFIRCSEEDTPATVTVPKLSGTVSSYTHDEKMRVFLGGREIGTTAWAKLYRTELFKTIKYPVGKNHEDVFTTYKLVHAANKISCIDTAGYVYRLNRKGLSHGFSPSRLDAIRGKLEQAAFIEKEYPNLAPAAYAGIVYACNICLQQISAADYRDTQTLAWMQGLYRRYGQYYLKAKVSGLGKCVAMLAMINIGLAAKALTLVR